MQTDKATITLYKTYACLPKTERGKFIKLGASPKGTTFLYTNDTSVIIRDAKDFSDSDIYSEHAKEATVAQYAPSGYYIASGDVTGKIRIWDTSNKEHILKYEYPVLGGAIKDIDWTGDSKRLGIAGQGRESHAVAIIWDTGSSVGKLSGPAKFCNAVAIRRERPIRMALGSEDFCVYFYENIPFKFMFSNKEHSHFVNCVKYAPDGSVFISGDSSGKAFIRDGKSGEIVGELGNPAHKGGIYDIAFSPDSKMILTCSGDKSAKIWSLPGGELYREFVFGSALHDMQIGCTWLHSDDEEYVITVSLSGFINNLDKDSGKIKKVIKGHKTAITAMTVSNGIIYSASFDGRLMYWCNHEGEVIPGNKEVSIQDLAVSDGQIHMIQNDGTLTHFSEETKDIKAVETTDSQPKRIAAASGVLVAACIDHIVVYKDNQKLGAKEVDFLPNSVAVHKDGRLFAVGGQSDKKIHLFNASSLTEEKCLDINASATDLQFSPDGNFLAAALDDRKVFVYTLPDYELVVEGSKHSAKINSIAWSPDSSMFATGSLDTDIAVWITTKRRQPIAHFRRAHQQKSVNKVGWLDQTTLVSAGQDCNIKLWKIEAEQ